MHAAANKGSAGRLIARPGPLLGHLRHWSPPGCKGRQQHPGPRLLTRPAGPFAGTLCLGRRSHYTTPPAPDPAAHAARGPAARAAQGSVCRRCAIVKQHTAQMHAHDITAERFVQSVRTNRHFVRLMHLSTHLPSWHQLQTQGKESAAPQQLPGCSSTVPPRLWLNGQF